MRFGVKSDTGLIRQINEDSYNIIAGYPGIPVCFIIADGMGGHNSGEVASKSSVDFVSSRLLQFPMELMEDDEIFSAIGEMVKLSNSHVYELSLEREENYGMGTTLIVAVVHNKKLYIVHIGDSRVYQIREGNMERLTTDHSYIEELIMLGSLTREEAENHPKKNIITRAIGCSGEIEIDTYLTEFRDEDTFLLCTDGLSNMLCEDEIKEIVLNIDDPQAVCEELVKRANEKGGEDNITVIVIKN